MHHIFFFTDFTINKSINFSAPLPTQQVAQERSQLLMEKHPQLTAMITTFCKLYYTTCKVTGIKALSEYEMVCKIALIKNWASFYELDFKIELGLFNSNMILKTIL